MAAGHGEDTNALSRSYSEPFPIPNQHQFNTINKVIAALPDGTDSWQPLDETCHSLGVDESYLPLFLKLGLERGKDWNAKWSNAKQSLATRGFNIEGKSRIDHAEVDTLDSWAPQRAARAGGFEVLKARAEQVNKRDRTNHQQYPAKHGPSTLQTSMHQQNASRSARLATANSVARPSAVAARDFLVEPRTDYHSSSDDYAGVPSRSNPSTFQSRQPMLTSTPRHSSTPLVDSAISARSAKNATPAQPQLHLVTSSPALNKYINSHATRARQTFYTPPPQEPPISSLQTAHEGRADDFRRLSLLSHGWYAWQASLSQIQARQAHLDQARRAVLLRWAFLKWRARAGRLQELDQIGLEVQRAREKDVLRRSVVRWVEAIDRKRRREWEEGLRDAWDQVRVRWKARLVRHCFEQWQAAALERRAIRFREDKLAGAALAKWQDKASYVGTIRAGAIKYDQQMVQHKSLDHWRHTTRLRHIERDFVQVKDRLVSGGALERWRDKT